MTNSLNDYNNKITDSVRQGRSDISMLKRKRNEIEEEIENTFMEINQLKAEQETTIITSSTTSMHNSDFPNNNQVNYDSYPNMSNNTNYNANNNINGNSAHQQMQPQQYQFQTNSWNDISTHELNFPIQENEYFPIDTSIPKCNCGLQAILLTSRQEKSMGNKFYCCPNPKDSASRCNFFQWENPELNERNYSTVPITNTSNKDHNIEIQHRFGHKGFRQGQRECIESALQGKDVFCLMPTGGGKSIVYQVCYSLLHVL